MQLNADIDFRSELILQGNGAEFSVNRTTTAATQSAAQSPTILQRIAKSDNTAVKDCIDAYGGLIWAIARKNTESSESANDLAQGIFLDIWQCAGRFDPNKFDELTFITLIARRRLSKEIH